MIASMNVSRRALIGGAIGVGAIGIFTLDAMEPYNSIFVVENSKSTPSNVDLSLSNPNSQRPLLEGSFTLDSDERIATHGIFSNDSRYLLTVSTANDSLEEEIETCCQGYSVYVYLKTDGIDIAQAHHD